MPACCSSRLPTDPAGRPRVAITGMGAVTPAGQTLADLRGALLLGRGLAADITRFDAGGLPTRIACQVPGFDVTDYVSPKAARRLEGFTQFAVAAALRSVEDAGLPGGDGERRGVVCGTALGGYQMISHQAHVLADQGPRRVSAFLPPVAMHNAPPGTISALLGWQGPAMAVTTACAAGLTAIGEAVGWIRAGACDVVVAGGADTGISPMIIAAFSRMGALSRRNDEPWRASRPFDAARDGYVIGEGAAFVVLESLAGAERRGARVYGEVAGYAQTCDAHHPTAPLPGGAQAARCMRLALADGGLAPTDIGHVNAHGTGTALNDTAEAAALHEVFGDTPPPVTAPKGVLGHLMGAAGAVEAIATALSIGDGVVPPVANHQDPDPEHRLDVVTAAREVGRRPAITSSFGLGGHNASLALAPHRYVETCDAHR